MTIERRVRIVADCDTDNPRTDWDCHAGRMLCWHRRYNLGDAHNYDCDDWKRELACEANDGLADYIDRLEGEVSDRLYKRAQLNGCKGWEECNEYAERFVRKRIDAAIDNAFDAGYVSLPLYLYDHSGITMSTSRFSCGWDSGCVGVIVCDEETIQREFAGDRDKALKALEAEVAVYDQYLTGDVWGFIAEEREVDEDSYLDDNEGWEETDSCWGFYGRDPRTNGMADHLSDDYADALDNPVYEY